MITRAIRNLVVEDLFKSLCKSNKQIEKDAQVPPDMLKSAVLLFSMAQQTEQSLYNLLQKSPDCYFENAVFLLYLLNDPVLSKQLGMTFRLLLNLHFKDLFVDPHTNSYLADIIYASISQKQKNNIINNILLQIKQRTHITKDEYLKGYHFECTNPLKCNLPKNVKKNIHDTQAQQIMFLRQQILLMHTPSQISDESDSNDDTFTMYRQIFNDILESSDEEVENCESFISILTKKKDIEEDRTDTTLSYAQNDAHHTKEECQTLDMPPLTDTSTMKEECQTLDIPDISTMKEGYQTLDIPDISTMKEECQTSTEDTYNINNNMETNMTQAVSGIQTPEDVECTEELQYDRQSVMKGEMTIEDEDSSEYNFESSSPLYSASPASEQKMHLLEIMSQGPCRVDKECHTCNKPIVEWTNYMTPVLRDSIKLYYFCDAKCMEIWES